MIGSVLKGAGLLFVWLGLGVSVMLRLPPLYATAWLVLVIAVFLYRYGTETHEDREISAVALTLRPSHIVVAAASIAVASIDAQILLDVYVPARTADDDPFAVFAMKRHAWIPMILAVAILGPLVEELVYRGRLLMIMRRSEALATRSGLMAAVSAIVFASSHGFSHAWWIIAGAGFFFSLLALRTGRWQVSASAHACANGLALLLNYQRASGETPADQLSKLHLNVETAWLILLFSIAMVIRSIGRSTYDSRSVTGVLRGHADVD